MSRIEWTDHGLLMDGVSTAATIESTNSVVLHGKRHVHLHVAVPTNTDAAGSVYILTRNYPGETWWPEPAPLIDVVAGVAITGEGMDFETDAAEVAVKYVKSAGGSAAQPLTVSFQVKD